MEILTDATDLSFTVVTGHLRGDHLCPFEIHATGCRDLKKMQLTQENYNVLAPTPKAAVKIAINDMDNMTETADYWIQPCCCLSRMRAAGRA
jgi:hypothetical protein